MVCTKCKSKNTQKMQSVYDEYCWQFMEYCQECGYCQWKPERCRNDDYGKEASNLMRAVNYMGIDYKSLALAMTYEHRTLQQSFMRLIVHYIEAQASNNSDMRNEATVTLCKRLQEVITEEGAYLPHV